MRILLILENYYPHIGGVELVFQELTRGFARRGHQVTVLTRRLPGTRAQEHIDGVKIVRVRSAGTRYLFTLSAISQAIRLARKADVIHTTTYNGAPPAWLAARLTGKRVILTVHETWIGKWREYTDFGHVRAWMHELLERCVFLLPYDRYACVSDATRAALVRARPRTASRAITIHNGFDPKHWKRTRSTQALRKHLGLEKKFVIFGYGRPGTSKGFTHLIDAFHIIKKHIPNAALVLVLSEDAQYAHKIVQFKRDAHPDTIFLPPQRYDDLPTYVQMADCVVVPSLTEGFGYVVLEANTAGTPVVASDTTSIPEVISGKHVLVRPGSARMIAQGVRRVYAGEYKTTKKKSFSWSKTVLAYEKIYKDAT